MDRNKLMVIKSLIDNMSSDILKELGDIAKQKEIIESYGENAIVTLLAEFLCTSVEKNFKEDWEAGAGFLIYCHEGFTREHANEHQNMNKYYEEKGITVQ